MITRFVLILSIALQLLPAGASAQGFIPPQSSLPLPLSQANGGTAAVVPSCQTTGVADTANIQAALNALGAGQTLYLLGGGCPYYVNQITIPNVLNGSVEGIGRPTIEPGTQSTPAYLFASQSYVSGGASPYTGNPFHWRNIVFQGTNGSTVAGSALISMSWNSDWENLDIFGFSSHGAQISSADIGGTSISTTIVNNRIRFSKFYNNGGDGLHINDTATKVTDQVIEANYLYGNTGYGYNPVTTAGLKFTQNHTYGNTLGGINISNAGVGTVVSNNQFEDQVVVNSVYNNEWAIGPGNSFGAPLNMSFGSGWTGNRSIISNANRYYGLSGTYGYILHSNDYAPAIGVSMNDTFDTPSPFQFSGGNTLGTIIVQNDVSIGATASSTSPTNAPLLLNGIANNVNTLPISNLTKTASTGTSTTATQTFAFNINNQTSGNFANVLINVSAGEQDTSFNVHSLSQQFYATVPIKYNQTTATVSSGNNTAVGSGITCALTSAITGASPTLTVTLTLTYTFSTASVASQPLLTAQASLSGVGLASGLQ